MSDRSIKTPISKGIADVPVIMQMEALECGAASLAMICAYYGKWIPLEQVRVDCGVSRDGASALNVVKAARSYGLTARGLRCEPEVLREKGTFPCIIHWNFNHFVVLCGFKGKYAIINDPGRGNVKVSMDEFDEAFTGIWIQFEPGENFKPGGKRRSTLEFARKRLSGAGPAVVFVMLTSIISALFEVINPGFTRFFMDRLLTGENRELLMPFITLLAAVGVLQVFVTAVQAIYSLRINGKMAVVGSSTFMWKVLRLPMEFFSQRMAGDILMRQNTNADIAKVIVETLTPLLINTAMMVFYLTVMIRYILILTLVGMASIVLNFFV